MTASKQPAKPFGDKAAPAENPKPQNQQLVRPESAVNRERRKTRLENKIAVSEMDMYTFMPTRTSACLQRKRERLMNTHDERQPT